MFLDTLKRGERVLVLVPDVIEEALIKTTPVVDNCRHIVGEMGDVRHLRHKQLAEVAGARLQ